MKTSSFPLIILLFTLLQVSLLSCQHLRQSNFSLKVDTFETVVLEPNVVVTLPITDIPSSFLYAMIQFHSQQWNLTLSSSDTFEMNTSKTGTNVGMVVPLQDSSQSKSVVFYLKSSNTTVNVTAVGILHFLSTYDPVPGGCNQVFNLERDPNIEITFSTGRTNLLFQWANEAAVSEPDCEMSQVQDNLEYEVYALFLNPRSLSENDFIDGVKDMMTTSSIQNKALKVTTLQNDDTAKPQLYVTSESSRGVIYSIVAHMKDTNRSTPYVAGVTYSCSFEKGDCSLNLSVVEIILTIVCAVCGGFLLTVGHRLFKISQVVFGYIFTFVLVYLLLLVFNAVHNTNAFIIAACLGILGGVLWLSLWLLFAFPMASVFVPGLCAGYLLSATLFFTPFADINWWERNDNYALAFVCVILLYTILLMAFPKVLNIVSCCIVGAFMLLMGAAIPVRSSLRLIVSHAFHRQTLEDFENVRVVVPTLIEDIILMMLWPALVILGVVIQLYRQRGRPAFDLPSRKRQKLLSRKQRRPLYQGDSEDEEDGGNRNNETERLISGASAPTADVPSYQSVDSPLFKPASRNKERNYLR